MSTPADSAIKMTSALEEKIASAQSGIDITEILRQAMLDQNLIVPDVFNPTLFYETPSVTPKGYAKVITINGQKHTLEATTETELLAKENALLRETFSTQPAVTEQPRDARGKFVSAADQTQLSDAEQAEVLRRSELELQFKRGELSAKTYIEQSGAVSEYLSERGIDESALQEVSSQKFAHSWESATSDFKERHPEWAGGNANRDLLGQLIIDNGLTESDPLEALEAVYDYAVKNNLLVENPTQTYAREISEARTASEIEAVNAKWFPNGRRASGSVLFDR